MYVYVNISLGVMLILKLILIITTIKWMIPDENIYANMTKPAQVESISNIVLMSDSRPSFSVVSITVYDL
jgi:hypothetical protein